MPTIWQLAKDVELQGKALYESLAESTLVKGLSDVFSLLAREEQRHYIIFEKLGKNMPVEFGVSELASFDIPGIFRTVAAEMQHGDEALKALDDAETGCRKALLLENNSIEAYRKMQVDSLNGMQKNALSLIIGEEKHHVTIIENLIEFIHRPKEWLENAEVNHHTEF
jgi:rubrerythrin